MCSDDLSRRCFCFLETSRLHERTRITQQSIDRTLLRPQSSERKRKHKKTAK
jgi:hypothetical protein